MAIETLIIWLIPLPPFLAFFLLILFTNKNKMLSHGLGVGAAILSWLGSMFVIYKALTDCHFSAFEGTLKWLPIG